MDFEVENRPSIAVRRSATTKFVGDKAGSGRGEGIDNERSLGGNNAYRADGHG
jgi:hypothetical protein